MSKITKRKAMRSGKAECPVCKAKRLLVEHHINGREIPGCRNSWNVAWVCPNCHDDVHAGEIVLEGWVMTTSGKELSWYQKDSDKPGFLPDSETHLY